MNNKIAVTRKRVERRSESVRNVRRYKKNVLKTVYTTKRTDRLRYLVVRL